MSKKKTEYQQFLQDYGANSERLHRIGIHSYGYGSGHVATVEDDPRQRGVDLPQCLVDKICDAIKVAYPDTKDDKKMIVAYKKRIQNVKKAQRAEKTGEQQLEGLPLIMQGWIKSIAEQWHLSIAEILKTPNIKAAIAQMRK